MTLYAIGFWSKWHGFNSCCGVSLETEQSVEALRDKAFTDDNPQIDTMTGEQALILLHRRQRIYPYMVNKLYRVELFDGIDFPEGIFVGGITQPMCS